MFLVHDSDRKARVIAPAGLRDEVTEFAVVLVLFQARVCLSVIRLQARQFIARFFTPQAGVCDLFAAVSSTRKMDGRGGGIENNTDRNRKDLWEILRIAETLKRNSKESQGILIGPSMAPRFFCV
jgi:hypothetical protein